MATLTLYYNGNDLITNTSVKYNTEIVGCLGYKQLQNAVIYSDSGLTTPSGNAFFDISVLKIPDATGNNAVYDTELGYFMFTTGSGQTNTIAFTIALYNTDTPGFLSGTAYNFEITSGSGIYLGAVGTVNYAIDLTTQIRTVTITYIVPSP